MKSPASEQPSPPSLYFDHLPAWNSDLPRSQASAEAETPVYLHRPSEKPVRTMRPYPSRGVLGVMLLLGSCGAAACWNAKPVPGGAAQHLGFDLRVKAPAPKVNITSAEAPLLLPPPVIMNEPGVAPPEPEFFKQSVAVIDVPAPPQSPVAHTLPLEEPKTLLPVLFQEAGSLACSCFRDLHRGDTPMLHNWNVIKLSSLVVATLAFNPVPVAAQDVTSRDLKEAIDNLGKKVEENNSSLVKALDGINGDLTRIKNDVAALGDANKTTTINVAALQQSLRELDERVKNLSAELERMKGKSDVRLYGPDKTAIDDIKGRLDKIDAALARLADGRISNAPPTNTGRILLANMYPETMLFVINGQSYRVAPYSTMPLDNQPAGVFSYEVISGVYGSVRANQPTLEPGKTYTITVR